MIREIAGCILITCVLLAGCVADQPIAKGTLELASSPSGAEVYLDSQYRGTTPSTITDVVPGNHTLEYRLNGYTSWKSTITVPSGTSHYYAALTASPVIQQTQEIVPVAIVSQPGVTVRVSRERMIVGDSMIFSGTNTGSNKVILTLYGPGYYANGIVLDEIQTDTINAWTFTWNPGTKILSGTFTIVASDSTGTVSDRKEFKVIGNGVVSVIPSSYAVVRGNTLTFSGQCTTGAPNIQLVLFGPDRFSSGVDLGTYSVTADNTWNFIYKLDNTMPTGQYTIYASDVPKTTSGSSGFTVGYAT